MMLNCVISLDINFVKFIAKRQCKLIIDLQFLCRNLSDKFQQISNILFKPFINFPKLLLFIFINLNNFASIAQKQTIN